MIQRMHGQVELLEYSTLIRIRLCFFTVGIPSGIKALLFLPKRATFSLPSESEKS